MWHSDVIQKSNLTYNFKMYDGLVKMKWGFSGNTDLLTHCYMWHWYSYTYCMLVYNVGIHIKDSISMLFNSLCRTLANKIPTLFITYRQCSFKEYWDFWRTKCEMFNFRNGRWLWKMSFKSSALDKMAAFFPDDIFRCIFANKKFIPWLKFHWNFQLTITQHWFR